MIETSKFIGELEANSPTNASLSRSREPTFRSKSKNSHEEKKSFNNKNDSKPLLASSNEASLAVDNNNSESQKQQGVSLHKKLSEKARSGSKSHSKNNSGNSNSFDVFVSINPKEGIANFL